MHSEIFKAIPDKANHRDMRTKATEAAKQKRTQLRCGQMEGETRAKCERPAREIKEYKEHRKGRRYQGWLWVTWSRVINYEVFGTEKNMTARDVTGFHAFFSARKSGNFLHILGRFPYSIAQKTWRKRKNIHWRNFLKIQWRRRPEIADFCPLS